MRKRSYTLLEILLVMLLVAVIFGTGGFKIRAAFGQAGFEAEVRAVLGQIALADEIMVGGKEDVWISFTEGSCTLQSNSFTKSLPLKTISHVTWEGGEGKLYFDGVLGSSARGELILYTKKEKKQLFLSGIPGQAPGKECIVYETSYPQKILSFA